MSFVKGICVLSGKNNRIPTSIGKTLLTEWEYTRNVPAQSQKSRLESWKREIAVSWHGKPSEVSVTPRIGHMVYVFWDTTTFWHQWWTQEKWELRQKGALKSVIERGEWLKAKKNLSPVWSHCTQSIWRGWYLAFNSACANEKLWVGMNTTASAQLSQRPRASGLL